VNIGFVAEHYPPTDGGVATSVQRVAAAMARLGAAVTVATFDHSRPLESPAYCVAEREVIGDEVVLTTAPPERLVEFYRRWYRPERMAVVVVGDIDPAAVQAALNERFSRIAPPPGAAAAPPALEVPLRPQPVSAVVADPETPATPERRRRQSAPSEKTSPTKLRSASLVGVSPRANPSSVSRSSRHTNISHDAGRPSRPARPISWQ